jgi:hypothetical protein
MDRLDPGDEPNWADMDEPSRDFYRDAISGLLDRTALIESALRFLGSRSPR